MDYQESTPRERWQQKCLGMTPDDLVVLEQAMLKYFSDNEKNILELQRQYQERGRGIDIVTATEYALRLDLHNKNHQESRKRIHFLENVLQYMIAVKNARQKAASGPINDFEVIQELKPVSQSFRPNYLDEMLAIEGFLEDYACLFQKEFMKIIDHTA